jgi:hypothetical protein
MQPPGACLIAVASLGQSAAAIPFRRSMTPRPIPARHWRSYGTEPLPSGAEALGEPFAAFPSWFLRIECDRCGKVRMGVGIIIVAKDQRPGRRLSKLTHVSVECVSVVPIPSQQQRLHVGPVRIRSPIGRTPVDCCDSPHEGLLDDPVVTAGHVVH